ncbi:HAD family hydrolase [Streptomyces sp. NPDC001691]|uniref:HAD family hydrolase n=1 Tax=unclassified Streptomyces TaxID=2593676 RepID=UPI000DE93C3A|nr:HAD family phosphatase [Streptomyces sp. SDr-06]RCH68838.1 HAD family phosphatase [Streptomyces sp. SDr-06]
MTLKTVWFDFGGVLSPPIPELFDAYHRKTGVTGEQLWAAMEDVGAELGMPGLAALEVAAVTEIDWGRRVARSLARRHPGIDLSRCEFETFGRQWFGGLEPNFLMISTLRQLCDAGFTVGLLTNNVVEWEPHWKELIGVADDVATVIDSCKVGVRKPDPKIFHVAAEAVGSRASDCLLIDDVLENCEAARREGWQAVHFQSDIQAARDIAFHTGVPSIV